MGEVMMNTRRLGAALSGLLLLGIGDAFGLTDLEREGLRIFKNETFDGNGRTCATCHRFESNFTLSPADIASLPPDDALFVHITDPNLSGLENDTLVKSFALFKTSSDPEQPNFRSVIHINGLSQSIDSPDGPRLGWAGQSEGDGSLFEFAIGAVRQHHTKSLDRVEGVDFRLPTEEELQALEAWQLYPGSKSEPSLPRSLANPEAMAGQLVFLDGQRGACHICHRNGGASTVGGGSGNRNFRNNTDLLIFDIAADTGVDIPRDPGDGRRFFNTVSLVDSVDSPPFFHNHAAETLRDAVAFYMSDLFKASRATRLLATGDFVVNMSDEEIDQVVIFLSVLNALQNLEEVNRYLLEALVESRDPDISEALLIMTRAQLRDVFAVLGSENIHQDVRNVLAPVQVTLNQVSSVNELSGADLNGLLTTLAEARDLMVEDESQEALGFTSITPDLLVAGRTQTVTITGSGFEPDMTLRLCQGIVVDNVEVIDLQTLTAELDVSETQRGACDLRLILRDGELVFVSDAVVVDSDGGAGGGGNEPLTIESVSPTVLTAGTVQTVSVEGSGFVPGAEVRLCRRGFVTADSVSVIDSNNLTMDVAVTPGFDGICNVRVSLPDGEEANLLGSVRVSLAAGD